MSMRDYGVDDYGLVLNTNHLQLLASKVLDDYSEDEWEEDRWGLVEELTNKLNIDYISEFYGTTFAVEDSGESCWLKGDPYAGDTIYYVSVSEYPNLFKRAYNNMDELVSEFKIKIGKYLPDNFDYRLNIKHIVGTYYA